MWIYQMEDLRFSSYSWYSEVKIVCCMMFIVRSCLSAYILIIFKKHYLGNLLFLYLRVNHLLFTQKYQP